MELCSKLTHLCSTSDQNGTYSNYSKIYVEMGHVLGRQHSHASFRTQGSRNRDSCGSWGSRNPASGRGPRASCRGPKIRPAVPDLVLLVVPKSSPRCGVLSGPLGGSGSHLDGTFTVLSSLTRFPSPFASCFFLPWNPARLLKEWVINSNHKNI